MKNSKEILEHFGKIMIEDCFLPCYNNCKTIREHTNPPPIYNEYAILFKKLSKDDFSILQNYIKENLEGMMFNMLRVFEEHEEFKLIYSENNQQINLTEISENLKAEPIIENGWIERYSEIDKNAR
jgi:hypothetical protein